MSSTNSWELLVDSKSDFVKIETKRSIRGLMILRAQGQIDWPAMDIYRCMQYKQFKKEWDINCDSTKYLKKIGVNAFIYHNKTVKKFVVASRDFVVNMLHIREQDGTVIILGSSTGCKFDYPPEKGVIRGESPLSGMII